MPQQRPFRAFCILPVLALLLGAIVPVHAEMLGDFALLDQDGVFHKLSRYRHKQAIVLMSYSGQCESTLAQVPRYRNLRERWQAQGIEFLMIDATAQASRANVHEEAQLYDIDFPILIDQNQLVAESLGLTAVPQVVVIDPNRMRVLFNGTLDPRRRRRNPQQQPLTETLVRIAAGEAADMEPVTLPLATENDGSAQTVCALEFPQREYHAQNTPDYAKDVAPILRENCVHCHSEGGIGPFAMNGYAMIRGWSAMMREVLMTKRMPPAQVDPEIGHFTNARYISDAELQTLVHWIDAGSPRGDGHDPLVEPFVESNETGWQLGEPDYIVHIPPQDVPATGVLAYRNVVIDLPFDEDKWVSAVHFRPGERQVLHHLLSYVIPPNFDWRSDNTPRSERRFLEGYAPGKLDAITYPENTGVYIPRGYKLSMRLHYTTYGKPTVDKTRVGLYFHDTPPPHEFHNKSVTQGEFVIPAGAVEHRVSQQYVFDKSIVLYGLRPHMHYRGKHFKFKVIYPNRTTEELLSVPNYDFNWQPTYRLESPKVLPAGSRVVISGAFDNSSNNPGNPDPTKEISWGAQSWDEMFIGYFAYHFVDADAIRTD